MKLKNIIVVLVLLVQLILAASPLIPPTARLWHLESAPDFHAVFATVIGIDLTLLSVVIILIMRGEGDELQDSINRITSGFPATIVTRLKDKRFYSDFRHATENADHTVKICYFAPYPPSEYHTTDRQKYYTDILALMKKRPNTTFKRIIRRTAKNDPWVCDLITHLEGKTNNSVALLYDLPVDREMPLALSVQLVDDNKVWLVATASHETEGEYRDVYIENAQVAEAISNYYDRLWLLSVKVLDRGCITADGNELIGGM
jgi:hypothetical protein